MLVLRNQFKTSSMKDIASAAQKIAMDLQVLMHPWARAPLVDEAVCEGTDNYLFRT